VAKLAQATVVILVTVAVGFSAWLAFRPVPVPSVPVSRSGPTASPALPTTANAARARVRTDVCANPLFPAECTSHMQARPTEVFLSGDGTAYADNLTWNGWGKATATATGQLAESTCQPDCAEGAILTYPVTITVTGLEPYGTGEAYGQMTFSAPSAPGGTTSGAYTGLVPG
jgi:hypothetical protein